MKRDDGHAGDSDVVAAYRARTARSAADFETARRRLAGGNTRMSAYWWPYPLTLRRGEGAFVWDADEHRYVDLLNNYSSLIHGHAHPEITEAITAQCRLGTCWPAYNEQQGRLAEVLCRRVRAVERIRFVNSGTEAGNLALTIARAATGRHAILMATGGYHGSAMEFLTGTAGRATASTLLAPFNDEAAFRDILRSRGAEIAAVFLEPVMGAGGIVAAAPEFLRTVREEAARAGALLVLDEVITLRLAPGGCQEVLEVAPDLTMFGKLIGGGLPVGAVGGRADVMALFDPPEPGVYHAGTFNGNPVTMAAGLAALNMLRGNAYDRLDSLGERMESGLLRIAADIGLPMSVNRAGSLLNVFLSVEAARSTFERKDAEAMQLFHLAALNEGVFFAPRGMMALSTAMTEATVDEALERLRDALRAVKNEGAAG